MRYQSIDRVEEDLRILVSKYQAGTIVFQDDHLMADKDRVYKILDIIKNIGVESLYQNGLTLYALDKPMLEAFYNAGVRHLVLPVESGSERVLKDLMKKPLKLRISERVAIDCRALGIYTNTNILIGMPGETISDLDEGRINLRKIPTNWFNIACASPIIGSDMHKEALEKNYIKIDNLGADYRVATIHTEDFTPEFIQDYQYRMNLELNFIYNSDMAAGEYKLALKAFNNVIRIREDHAFAHYFAALCYREIGQAELMNNHFQKYLKFYSNDLWSKWVIYFSLVKSQDNFKLISPGAPAKEELYNRCENQLVEIDVE